MNTLRHRRSFARCAVSVGILVFAVSAVPLRAAPVFQNDLGPVEGVTSDVWDFSLGGRIVTTTQTHPFAGGPDPSLLIGATATNGWVEPTRLLFNDGPGAGTVDIVEWQTASAINLDSFSLRLAQDGGTGNRGTSEFKLFGTQDGVIFSQLSGGLVPLDAGAMQFPATLITDNALTGATTALRGFRLEITRLTAGGPRLVEMDGFGSAAIPAVNYLDRIAFNTSTISLAGSYGEGAGLAGSFSVSSAVAGGADTPEDAFGRNNGAVEPETFIFGDGGAADNGNAIFGDGGETVDFLQWHTDAPLTLAGFRIGLAGDGLDSNRDTEFVRFLVEGVEVDLFDNNGFNGDITRLFAGGAVTGDDFRLEFTRTTSAGGRVFEVDAITGVPEPSSAALLVLSGTLLARRRRK